MKQSHIKANKSGQYIPNRLYYRSDYIVYTRRISIWIQIFAVQTLTQIQTALDVVLKKEAEQHEHFGISEKSFDNNGYCAHVRASFTIGAAFTPKHNQFLLHFVLAHFLGNIFVGRALFRFIRSQNIRWICGIRILLFGLFFPCHFVCDFNASAIGTIRFVQRFWRHGSTE